MNTKRPSTIRSTTSRKAELIGAGAGDAGQSAADAGGGYRHRGQQLLPMHRPMGSSPARSHPGMFNPQKLALQPRAGLAYRIDDKTAFRFGYARYLIPYEMNIALAPVSGYETVGFLEPPFLGMTGYQNTLAPHQGVPQETISNPYPTSSNPLLPILGTGYGGNLGRGGQPLLWYNPNQQKARNDRFNFNIQRQLRGQIVVSGTYFLNIGNQQYTKALNQINPALETQYQNQLNHAGGESVLPLPEHDLDARSAVQPADGFVRFVAGALSAVRRLVRTGRAGRGRALSVGRIEGAEGLQQGLQLPGHLRVHPRESPDQRLPERRRLQRPAMVFEHARLAGQQPAPPPLEHRGHLGIADREGQAASRHACPRRRMPSSAAGNWPVSGRSCRAISRSSAT